MTDDPRRHSPAAERNRGPILAQLQRRLPARGTLLEIASGTGQHAAFCAEALPQWQWQPTDFDPRSLPSIDAWCEGLRNVRPALVLDVMAPVWTGAPAPVDAVFCANMIHISPWPTCAALMRGARRHLAPGGLLWLYGPFIVDGEPLAPGNVAFDADLKARDASWGLRRLSDVRAAAATAGLRFDERIAMPANNLMLVFEAAPPT